MEYFIIAILLIIVVLLVVILARTKKTKDDSPIILGEEEVYKIRDSVRHDNEESFSRFQNSLDRDMTKVGYELKTMGERMDSRLSKSEESMNTFMTNVMDRMRKESDLNTERSISSQKAIEGNFDRIREENRLAFHDFSDKTEKLTLSVKEGMEGIKKGNEEKLKEIQNVVDQKLQETLDKRIATSFKAVTEKSRGVWGEMQAENILSDILTNEEWVRNFSPRGNREMVEFAIRMPGKEGDVYLPIDSKFPVSDLERYKEAVDLGDEKKAEIESKNLRDRILSEAKDINKKYVVPPVTTDFAILFVPSETIYLEAIKMDGLVERLQNDYRVVLSGPNNFAALLNSLRLGFRTMQIEEYTSTIWHLFEDMKKLFADLSKSIDDSKKQIDKASESLEGAKRKKEKITTVLSHIESSAEKAAIDDIDAYYEESKVLVEEKKDE